MGRAMEAMGFNGPDKPRVAVPAEYARAEWSIERPPSAAGLKVLALIFAQAGNDLRPVLDVPVTELRAIPAVASMSIDDLAECLRGLVDARVEGLLDHGDGRLTRVIGSVLSLVRVRSDGAGLLSVHVRFGDAFVEMAERSDVYAMFDKAAVLAMRSRYSLLLYQFLASHWRKSEQRSIKLTLADWRKVFAIPAKEYPRFADFNQRALVPALAEVSDLSRYALTVERHHKGRAVVGLSIGWKLKPAVADVEPEAEAVPGEAVPKPASRAAKPSLRSVPLAAHRPTAPVSEDERLQLVADRVNGLSKVPVTDVSPSKARALLERRMVTEEQLRLRGVQW